MRQINRRAFLKLAGVSAAAAALYESSGSILQALNLIDWTTPTSQEAWVPSVCQLCPAECGLRVRVVGGLALKIEGNLQNPNNQGRTCPKGQVGLQLLYNPDRVQTPLKRVGERGEGRWQAISWDEAIGTVAARLRDVRLAGAAERTAFLYDQPPGLLGETMAHFCRAMGTPNAIDLRPDALSQAVFLTQGWATRPGYDLNRTRCLLSFNCALLESAQPTVRLLAAYSFMRRGRPGDRGRIVQIEPRLSVTAIKADEWVPIQPGTEGALALGLAWVILRERLYDSAFMAEHGHGFEAWSQAVLSDYPPSSVASLTGVPEETIKRLAREFAGASPAVAMGGTAVDQQTNGLASQMAIHTLNALVGSVDVPGGVVMQCPPPLAPWPRVFMDDVTTRGLAQPRLDGPEDYPGARSVPHRLPEAIVSGDPYPLEALLLYRANPLHDAPDPEAWRAALERVPLIVSFDPFIEETSAYADYVLPDHTFLERWTAAPLFPSLSFPMLAVGQPVVEPLYDTRAFGDVLIQLARQVGGGPGASFPWVDYLELLRFRVRGLMESGRGSIRAATEDEFWHELAARGVWVDSPYRFAGAQEVITRDNVTVHVDAVLYFQVINAEKAVCAVRNYVKAMTQLAVATLRSVLGQSDLDELLAHRDRINERLQNIIDEHTEDPWGVLVTLVEVRDVLLPEGMQRAMARQAEAEREKRAKIIHTEGEELASQALANAANTLGSAPPAIQLRYLQTLVEMAGEQNSTIIPLPLDIVTALSEGLRKGNESS